jgi:hypothetical protein
VEAREAIFGAGAAVKPKPGSSAGGTVQFREEAGRDFRGRAAKIEIARIAWAELAIRKNKQQQVIVISATKKRTDGVELEAWSVNRMIEEIERLRIHGG